MANALKACRTNLLLVVIVLTVYLLVYASVVAPAYNFGGLSLDQDAFNLWPLGPSLCAAFILPVKPSTVESLFASLSVYLILLPSAVLCMIGGKSGSSFILIAAACLAPLLVVRMLGKARLACASTTIRLKTWPFIACVGLTILATAWTARFRFNISFMDVYSYRGDFNDSLQFPLNYVLPFVGGPLLSLLAAFGCLTKDRRLIAFAVVSSLLLFGFSSHKSYFIGLLLALLLYAVSILRLNLSYVFGSLMIGFSVLALTAADLGGGLIGSLIANRLIFVPSAITYEFINQFSEIGPLYWAESKLSLGLVESPLPLNSVNYIAKIMTGLDGVGANSGWVANGYMNGGILGVAFYAVLIGFILVQFQRWQFTFGAPVVVATMAQPLYNLIASMDLAAWLLTGGILPLMVIFLFLGRFSVRRQHS